MIKGSHVNIFCNIPSRARGCFFVMSSPRSSYSQPCMRMRSSTVHPALVLALPALASGAGLRGLWGNELLLRVVGEQTLLDALEGAGSEYLQTGLTEKEGQA